MLELRRKHPVVKPQKFRSYGQNELVSFLDEVTEDMADAQAAMGWSTPSDDMTEKDGEDVLVVGDFGNRLAVNGDLVDDWPSLEGYEEVSGGGRVPTTEEEVSLEHAIDRVVREQKADPKALQKAAEKFGKDYGQGGMVYRSSSGETSVYRRVA